METATEQRQPLQDQTQRLADKENTQVKHGKRLQSHRLSINSLKRKVYGKVTTTPHDLFPTAQKYASLLESVSEEAQTSPPESTPNLMSTLEHKIQQLQEDVALGEKYRDELCRLKQDYAVLQAQTDELRVRCEDADRQLVEWHTQALAAQEQLAEKNSALADMQRFVADGEQRLADQHVLSDSNKELRLQIKELTQAKHRAQQQQLSLLQERRRLEERVDELQVKLDDEREEKQARLRDLWTGYEAMCDDYEELNRELEEVCVENEGLRHQLDESMANVLESSFSRHMACDLVQEMVHMAVVQSEMNALACLSCSAEHQLRSMKDISDELKHMKLQLTHQQQDHEALLKFAEEEREMGGQLLEDLERELEQLKSTHQQVLFENSFLKQQLDAKASADNCVSNDDIVMENAELKACLKEVKQRAQDKINSLKENLSAAENEVDALDQLLEHVKSQLVLHQSLLPEPLVELVAQLERKK